MTHIALNFENRIYKVEPEFDLICEIEDELGALPELYARFANNEWKVSELVTLVHMMLQNVGRSVDFLELGDGMMKEGLNRYLHSTQNFLQLVLHSK